MSACKRCIALLGALAFTLAQGCKSTKNPEQKFFDEVSQLTKEQVMAKGDDLFEKKRLEEARKYYSFLADSFPNDPLGRRAGLKVGDTFFAAKDLESLTEASLRYKDFANRFPNDPNRGYALMMLGKCSFQQRRGPLRDLASLREAADSFQQVVKLYPNTDAAAQAAEMLAQTTEDLAQHELIIARFYQRIGALGGARLRVNYLLANYPSSKAAQEAAGLRTELEQMSMPTKQSGTAPQTSEPTVTPLPQSKR